MADVAFFLLSEPIMHSVPYGFGSCQTSIVDWRWYLTMVDGWHFPSESSPPMTTIEALPLPAKPFGGNMARACARRGGFGPLVWIERHAPTSWPARRSRLRVYSTASSVLQCSVLPPTSQKVSCGPEAQLLVEIVELA